MVYGVVDNPFETDRLHREADSWMTEIGHQYPAVADFAVEDIFATHRSLRMRLHLAAFTQQKHMWYKPAPLGTTPRISLSTDTIMHIFSHDSEEWEDHILVAEMANSADARRAAIDALFTIWSERAGDPALCR